MKVCIVSESPADESALAIVVEAVRAAPLTIVPPSRLRARGWPSVRNVLPSALKHLHFRTDADGAVFIADSDDSPVHDPKKPGPTCSSECRLCELRALATDTLGTLKPMPGRRLLRVAIGLAVPSIEAWLLTGTYQQVGEVSWSQAMTSRQWPYTRADLKTRLYGTDRPSLELEQRKMEDAARRISTDLKTVERWFPEGFGALMSDLRSW